jgi:hypothetical protein
MVSIKKTLIIAAKESFMNQSTNTVGTEES